MSFEERKRTRRSNLSKPRRMVIASAISIVGAATIGLLAGWVRGDSFWLAFIAFGIVALPTLFGLAWILLGSPGDGGHYTVEQSPDSIEHIWARQAAVEALRDLLLVLGLATALTSMLDIDSMPSVVFLIIAMVDWFGRTMLLSWRER